MAKESRKRMVASAASLIGSRGASATSFSDVLADSHAPRGSIYHHFPKGKQQLVAEAVQWTTEQVLAYQRSCTATEPTGVLDHFVTLFRHSMVTSECRAGCPVAGIAIDTYGSEGNLRQVVRASFRSWVDLLGEQLERTGVDPRVARTLSVTTVAAVEGALILCRAEGSVSPLEDVAEDLRRLALGTRRPGPTRGLAGEPPGRGKRRARAAK
ncbi:MAG: TetR/AcrR family transcriptional regulator [Thermoplasmata archaeon]|nr:TetR/AcrR family transcriptional regulator [Thermoplasmata archaeon]